MYVPFRFVYNASPRSPSSSTPHPSAVHSPIPTAAPIATTPPFPTLLPPAEFCSDPATAVEVTGAVVTSTTDVAVPWSSACVALEDDFFPFELLDVELPAKDDVEFPAKDDVELAPEAAAADDATPDPPATGATAALAVINPVVTNDDAASAAAAAVTGRAAVMSPVVTRLVSAAATAGTVVALAARDPSAVATPPTSPVAPVNNPPTRSRSSRTAGEAMEENERREARGRRGECDATAKRGRRSAEGRELLFPSFSREGKGELTEGGGEGEEEEGEEDGGGAKQHARGIITKEASGSKKRVGGAADMCRSFGRVLGLAESGLQGGGGAGRRSWCAGVKECGGGVVGQEAKRVEGAG